METTQASSGLATKLFRDLTEANMAAVQHIKIGRTQLAQDVRIVLLADNGDTDLQRISKVMAIVEAAL